MKSSSLMIIFLSVLFSSCLNLNTDEYTVQDEQADIKKHIDYLHSKGNNVDTTALGVYYVIREAGTGPLPAAGDTISVKYVGYLMNGNVFSTSFYISSDSSWTYVYKVEELLDAWDEVTGLMNKGCKMEFIIPSTLAYGATGNGNVPPNSSLIFVTRMADIKKKK